MHTVSSLRDYGVAVTCSAYCQIQLTTQLYHKTHVPVNAAITPDIFFWVRDLTWISARKLSQLKKTQVDVCFSLKLDLPTRYTFFSVDSDFVTSEVRIMLSIL